MYVKVTLFAMPILRIFFVQRQLAQANRWAKASLNNFAEIMCCLSGIFAIDESLMMVSLWPIICVFSKLFLFQHNAVKVSGAHSLRAFIGDSQRICSVLCVQKGWGWRKRKPSEDFENECHWNAHTKKCSTSFDRWVSFFFNCHFITHCFFSLFSSP